MTRASCPTPDRCSVPDRGRCHRCDPVTPAERAVQGERMRRRHREPEFAAAHAKRSSDRLKALWADPEYRARQIAMLRTRNEARRTAGQAVGAAVEVPAWAERAGLAATYRTVAASKGEEAAAKHCRAITAARRSGALA